VLNASDPATFISIRELRRSVLESNKPLIFWVGAGASSWLGYPLWKELAHDLRREFFKFVEGFDKAEALKLIQENSFPDFFQRCRELDRARYYRFLSTAFLPRPESILYKRFAEELGQITPLHILTTNIDEALEQRFPIAIFQRSDLSGCIEQLQGRNSFIAKLHGSRGAIESAVFTREDYKGLKSDKAYLNNLGHIFALGTVIFLGYSVSDQYVVDLLSDNARDMSLFGAGPHFVVSSALKGTSTIHPITYSLQRFPDHRAALTVLDIIRQTRGRQGNVEHSVEVKPQPHQPDVGATPLGTKTIYFISDFMPAGTWVNSITSQIANENGLKAEMTLGLGFNIGEVPSPVSTAPYDLVVGLICFDYVYFPLSAVDKVHALLGSDFFWQLAQAEIIRFVHMQHEPAVMSLEDSVIGDVGLVSITDPSSGRPQTPGHHIRRLLVPAPGRESIAEKLFSDLENKVIVFGEAENIDLAGLVRASMMMPDVAGLLGIGEAILPSQVPKWLTFPCLRMAHLVHTGAVCDKLGIQAAKIPFGGARLASAAFGVQPAAESADQYASYVLSGTFNADIGAALVAQPRILQDILHFRDTTEGEAFRREVHDQLLTDKASEFSASVNAGLARNIPIRVLQEARDKFSSLVTENIKISPVPAVWTNTFQSDNSTRLWRLRSRAMLLDLAKKRSIGKDDPCICGSGENLRLCCMLPLRD
jgi:hypothetical protein